MEVINKQTRSGQQLVIAIEGSEHLAIGFPVAAVYLNGTRIAEGEVRHHCQGVERLPLGCQDTVACMVALPRGEGEMVAGALVVARAAWSAGKERRSEENIRGISEMREATDAWERYQDGLVDYAETGIKGFRARRPKADLNALRRQYPLAALYVRAWEYWVSANEEKSTIGERAYDLLTLGGDPEEVEAVLDAYKAR
jgi:hypothetical protein